MAAKFLAGQGYQTGGYRLASRFSFDDDAKTFLEREAGLEQANRIMGTRVRLWRWSYRWFQPRQKEEYRVDITPSGQFAGFEHQLPEEAARSAVTPEQARALAEAFLRARLARDPASLDFVEASEIERLHRTDRTFTAAGVQEHSRDERQCDSGAERRREHHHERDAVLRDREEAVSLDILVEPLDEERHPAEREQIRGHRPLRDAERAHGIAERVGARSNPERTEREAENERREHQFERVRRTAEHEREHAHPRDFVYEARERGTSGDDQQDAPEHGEFCGRRHGFHRLRRLTGGSRLVVLVQEPQGAEYGKADEQVDDRGPGGAIQQFERVLRCEHELA